MARQIGVVMDPIRNIKIHKDSTFAMLLEAQQRGSTLFYMELADLWLDSGSSFATMRVLHVRDDPDDWFELEAPVERPLADLDLILMRKDPPFDMEYIYATYLLERAAGEGVRVVNEPQGLRDANEKLFTAWFPDLCPATLVTSQIERLRSFVAEQGEAVIKPLDGMGGTSVFRLKSDDPNVGVVAETLTQNGTRMAVAQRYLPEIKNGDKRILMINGKPVPYALARIPGKDDFRGNLARGARGEAVDLSERDRAIAARVGPELIKRGLIFVGLDVIGDYLTEINVTSPTCIRELDRACNLNIAGDLFDALEASAR